MVNCLHRPSAQLYQKCTPCDEPNLKMLPSFLNTRGVRQAGSPSHTWLGTHEVALFIKKVVDPGLRQPAASPYIFHRALQVVTI